RRRRRAARRQRRAGDDRAGRGLRRLPRLGAGVRAGGVLRAGQRGRGASMTDNGYQILTLDELEPVHAPRQEAKLLTLRRELGVRAFGVNGWRGDEGERVVPPHDEDSGNEELYIVVQGRATFTIGEEERDAPAGTLLFIQPETHRAAVAREDGTI